MIEFLNETLMLACGAGIITVVLLAVAYWYMTRYDERSNQK